MTTRSNALNKLFIIIAMAACYAMIFIDESGIAVTLPKIQQTLTLSSNATHWIVNSYLLTLSVLLLLGGKLSDIYGKRRVFTLGIGIFLISSIICATASSGMILIIGQLLLGVGASLLMPCTMVLISASFPKDEFGKAFGIILGFSNFFYAIGPFIGGALTEFASWRWFFAINIPIGIICLCFTFLAIAKDKVSNNIRFTDIKGLITSVIALSALIFGVMQGAEYGWGSIKIIGLFIIVIVCLAAFVKIELQSKDPLLDLRLFRIKTFLAGNVILLCASICLTSMVFWAIWLQASLGFSPATVGLALLPATLTFIAMPTIAGAWRDKSGPRAPMLLGSSLILFGVLWLAVTAHSQSYLWLITGFLAFGFGLPLTIPNSCTTIMTSVSPEHEGMASGTLTTVRQLGLSIGIAIMSAVISSYTNSHFAQLLKSSTDYAGVTTQQLNLLLAGKNIIQQLSAEKITLLKTTAGLIYTHAFICGMLSIGIFAVIACVFTVIFIRNPK